MSARVEAARGWRDDLIALLLVVLVFGPGGLCLAVAAGAVGAALAIEARLPLVIEPELAAGGVAGLGLLVFLGVTIRRLRAGRPCRPPASLLSAGSGPSRSCRGVA